MSLDKFQKALESISKTVENTEKFATPVLAAKISRYLEVHPHDQTLGAMSRVISKMASNNKNFISKSDLKSLYNKLYTRNTKFAELFQEELGEVNNLSSPKVFERDEASELHTYDVGDQVLANALNSVFDNSPLKMYSQTVADKAIKSVASELDSWNIKASNLEVVKGNENVLLIKADYETPKGVTSFFVPVETKNNKVSASIFLGNLGIQDLNNSNIKGYLKSQTGEKLRVNADQLFNILVQATTEKREVSNVEVALAKLNSEKETNSEFFQNQIVGQKVSEASVKDVELPKYDEFSSFEDRFTSPLGIAIHQFGNNVKEANDFISFQLKTFGYNNPQIKVLKTTEDTIFYGVSLDSGKVAFTVPVKVIEKKASKPNIIICNGSISSFDKKTINSLYINNDVDYKVAAAASPQFDLTPADLINNISDAMADGNYDKAEDALNVLASKGDAKAYAIGFNVYKSGFINKTAEKSCGCNMVVKTSASKYDVCGHTGLPVHKVYQDKEGNCRPLYRKGMDETYQGSFFMNSKIFG